MHAASLILADLRSSKCGDLTGDKKSLQTTPLLYLKQQVVTNIATACVLRDCYSPLCGLPWKGHNQRNVLVDGIATSPRAKKTVSCKTTGKKNRISRVVCVSVRLEMVTVIILLTFEAFSYITTLASQVCTNESNFTFS